MNSSMTPGDDEHVLIIKGLPLRQSARDGRKKDSWKLVGSRRMIVPLPDNGGISNQAFELKVKDLIRALLQQEFKGQSSSSPRDERRVDVHDNLKGGHPYATTSFKNREHAERIFERLAGHSWHGSILEVHWVHVYPNKSWERVRSSSACPNPFPLEEIIPIRDATLLRPQAQSPGSSLLGQRTSTSQLNRATQQPLSLPVPDLVRNIAPAGSYQHRSSFSSSLVTSFSQVSESRTVIAPVSPAPYAVDNLQESQIQNALNYHTYLVNSPYVPAYPANESVSHANIAPSAATPSASTANTVGVRGFVAGSAPVIADGSDEGLA